MAKIKLTAKSQRMITMKWSHFTKQIIKIQSNDLILNKQLCEIAHKIANIFQMSNWNILYLELGLWSEFIPRGVWFCLKSWQQVCLTLLQNWIWFEINIRNDIEQNKVINSILVLLYWQCEHESELQYLEGARHPGGCVRPCCSGEQRRPALQWEPIGSRLLPGPGLMGGGLTGCPGCGETSAGAAAAVPQAKVEQGVRKEKRKERDIQIDRQLQKQIYKDSKRRTRKGYW